MINHNSFPHIIDCIWQNLDYEGQLFARAVCRQWRDRADSRLRYISFHFQQTKTRRRCETVYSRDLATPFAPAVRLHNLEHWLPAQGLMRKTARESVRRRTAPIESRPPSRADIINYQLATAIMRTARVIDFVGFWDRYAMCLPSGVFLDQRYSPPFDQCIIRWFEGSISPRAPETFVDEEASFSADVVMLELRSDWAVQTLFAPAFRNRRKKVIINYACYTNPTTLSLDYSVIGYEVLYVSDVPVVVVLHNRIDASTDSDHETLQTRLIREYSNLVHIGCTIDIVGLEEFLPPGTLAPYVKLVKEEIMKGRFMYEIEDEEDWQYDEDLKYWWTPEVENLDRLRFWTHAEYREHVGDEMYRIHTVR